MNIKLKYLLIVIFVFLEGFLYSGTDLSKYQKISCVLHIHSSISKEQNPSIEEIVQRCAGYNIDAIVFNDSFIEKVSCGIYPFHRLIKKSYEGNSVVKYGIKKYLSEIESVAKKYPQTVIFPGVEITPAYYWEREGSNFILNNYHKHMLIIGFDKEEYYKQLPVIENEITAGRFQWYSLWPVVGVIFTFLFFRRGFLRNIFLILFLLVFLAKYPFKYLPFDNVSDYGELPYQGVIDYVDELNKRLGENFLILWAHPEAKNWQQECKICENKYFNFFLKTEIYPESLLDTKNYDGFSIFAEGYRYVGKIGGIWDKALLEFCKGERERPVWCFAEVDYVKGLDDLYFRKNIVYVKEKTKKEILSALKSGRFYTVWRDRDRELLLEDINMRVDGEDVLFGDVVRGNKKVVILGRVKFSDGQSFPVSVNIIKDGVVIKSFVSKAPYGFKFEDDLENNFNEVKRCYYRIFVESKYPFKIATNPIIVEKG